MKGAWAVVLAAALAACTPHVVLEQNKPFDINVNFTGHLDVTLHAEKDLEAITGEKPVNKVRPEDIGLPAAGSGGPAGGGAVMPADARPVAVGMDQERWVPVLLARRGSGSTGRERMVQVSASDDAKAAMKARDPQIRALWDGKLVGENHVGLLVARGALTPAQQKLVDAENADRTVVYKAEAAATAAQVEAVGLIYYQARLGYAKQGAWYEKRNAAGVWEWKQWGMP